MKLLALGVLLLISDSVSGETPAPIFHFDPSVLIPEMTEMRAKMLEDIKKSQKEVSDEEYAKMRADTQREEIREMRRKAKEDAKKKSDSSKVSPSFIASVIMIAMAFYFVN